MDKVPNLEDGSHRHHGWVALVELLELCWPLDCHVLITVTATVYGVLKVLTTVTE
jgi:hypothetical protein